MPAIATRGWVDVSPMGLPCEEGYAIPYSTWGLGLRRPFVVSGGLMAQAPWNRVLASVSPDHAVGLIVTESPVAVTFDSRKAQGEVNFSNLRALSRSTF